MRLISNRKTLAGQLAILIALAFAIAAALFIAADRISTKAIGKYLEASSYVERQNDMYAEKLQEFVTENDISSRYTRTIHGYMNPAVRSRENR